MKVLFRRDDIRQELPGLILLSHGPMAVAVAESASMIVGEQPNMAAFGLEPEDPLEEYIAAVLEAYEVFGGNAVFLVDLYGGTPCNQLVLAALKNQLPVKAIGGMNLPMLLEAVTLREEAAGEELISQLEMIGNAGIVNITDKMAGR